ncbi:hypothetical protein [Prevotella sp. oral taxon 317]|jgi:hypothetical protein|uniref:hypothetical protein n=1 Tax=Prevotella sp. oral taxon 317 TaxID=652721 RepID=UPI0001C40885|nr:hypothetical protein [Prevotella sp. oral taxon 317]EFC67196.1 hypothetical protein HMPREF0670_02827 [Prevotella sp. oral taxon 317 str. F0108]
MKSLVFILAAFIVAGSCGAQRKVKVSKIKGGKQMTTEKIDKQRFHWNKDKNDIYTFVNYKGQKVVQRWMSSGGVYYFYETRRKENELIEEYRRYFNAGKLNVEGFQYKDNGFEVGIWKIYDGDGKLVEVRDYDAPFKNYPWEEVRKFLERERGIDFFDKRTTVSRYVDEKHPAGWGIRYYDKKNQTFKYIGLDCATRKIVEENEFSIVRD